MSSRTRTLRRSLSVATLLLAVAPAPRAHSQSAVQQSTDAAPIAARACPSAASHTGTYRVTLQRERAEPVFALLVFEREGGCLSALLVLDRTQTVIQSLSLQGDALSGTFRTETGDAKLSLRFTETGVTGQVVQGKKAWSLQGDRTS